MTPAARGRFEIRVPLALASAVAWFIILLEPGGTTLSILCSAGMSWSPPSLALGWALMLVAMMTPLLTGPVRSLRERSFAERRARAILLFLLSYAFLWMTAGGPLLTVAVLARRNASGSSFPLVAATLVAMVWQVSPAKQLSLNRCHRQAEISAFGWAADRDALSFGLRHGLWCVGSCWALMLLPLLVSRGHVVAMAGVTLWVFVERLDRAVPPAWRWHGGGKARRIVMAQARCGFGAGIRMSFAFALGSSLLHLTLGR